MSLFGLFNRNVPYEKKFNQHETGVFQTPDAPALDAKGEHLVFIYDNMMPRGKDYYVIRHLIAEAMGPGLALYYVEAYKHKDTEKVVAIPPHNGGRLSATIRGHLFKVNARTVKELDRWYGNNVDYKRTDVVCESWKRKENKAAIYVAWMYIAIPEVWGVDGGFYWEPLSKAPPNYFTPEKHYHNFIPYRSKQSVRLNY